MRTVLVIGIGTGNPEHMTIQAIKALNRADVVLLPRKGKEKADLAELRRDICRLYLTSEATRIVEFDLPTRDEAEPSYVARVADWHGEIAILYGSLMDEHIDENGTVALLVWGDPSLYDSTLRILGRLLEGTVSNLVVEVVPGITSLQALCASHAIPLNEVGQPVRITTGRRLRHDGAEACAQTTAVMLDGELSFETLPLEEFDIHWGAYLGSSDEILVSGPLQDVAPEIRRVRTEARERRGWIMDTYVLRRRRDRKTED